MGGDAIQIGLDALAGLLDEFGKGNIFDLSVERDGLTRHAGRLSERWDQRFPGFPEQYFPFTSMRGEFCRYRRDAYLKSIIVELMNNRGDGDTIIVNPACVIGRHTRDLASRLKRVRVIGTDIDPIGNRLYGLLRVLDTPVNFEFTEDNIFEPKVSVTPTAVVFFGACGAVSDAAIDYAIDSKSPYLMCRTCCHDNIGGNTTLVYRPTLKNWFFRWKNWGFAWMHTKKKYAGFYFSDKYTKDHYPRSEAARSVSDSDQFLEVARNSAESDICRAIIDLDRYLLLVERGYNVWYQGELFVAERR